jgi:hypothetical protein
VGFVFGEPYWGGAYELVRGAGWFRLVASDAPECPHCPHCPPGSGKKLRHRGRHLRPRA